MKNAVLYFAAAVFFAAVFAGCGRENAGRALADADMERERLVRAAKDAYVYGFPLVLNEVIKRAAENPLAETENASINRIRHFNSFADETFAYFIRPDSSVFYSFAWLDVSKEPMLIEIPETGKRYVLFSLFDGWGDVFASLGSRLSGGNALKAAVCGPGWQGVVPQGFEQYKADTAAVLIKAAIEVKNKQDGETAVKKIQNGIKLYPLSAYGGQYRVPEAVSGVIPGADMPLERVLSMDISDFFNTLNWLMMKNPPRPQDAKLLDEILDIGVAPGMRFDISVFDFDTREAFKEIPQWMKSFFEEMKNEGMEQGWIYGYGFGDYKDDYVFRAKTAYYLPAADRHEDLLCAFSYFDRDKEKYDSSKKYVLHFDKNALPPVKAGWSLCAYNDRGLVMNNPGGRRSISGRDGLEFNKDGSLDIYIQKENPGKNRLKNWLPVSGNGFALMLRCYLPEKALTDGVWKAPAVEKTR